MPKLSRQSRKTVKRDDFAIPDYAPGPRGYPIPTSRHAVSALETAKRYGDEGDYDKVLAAVRKKYPYGPWSEEE